MKRLVLIGVLLLVLAGGFTAWWTATDRPPVLVVLRHGWSPECRPTGRTLTVGTHEFVEIGAGGFRMGSAPDQEEPDWFVVLLRVFGLGEELADADPHSKPVHWIAFAEPFWVARTEVTNAEYMAFDPDQRRADDSSAETDPVVRVTWQAARDFCSWLETRTGLPMRLPSESEWECGCRAGSSGNFSFGDDEEQLSQYARTGADAEARVVEVGTLKANAWGLIDMHGNVYEWCEDTWHDDYRETPRDGSPQRSAPAGETGPAMRVVRGGSWLYGAVCSESATRGHWPATEVDVDLGMRLFFSLDGEDE